MYRKITKTHLNHLLNTLISLTNPPKTAASGYIPFTRNTVKLMNNYLFHISKSLDLYQEHITGLCLYGINDRFHLANLFIG